MIERAVVVCDGTMITVADLPLQVTQAPATTHETLRDQRQARPERNQVRLARAARHARERADIAQALEQTNCNRSEAALRLGIARSTLISRMKKFGLLDVNAG